jgi:peptide chain release factor 1
LFVSNWRFTPRLRGGVRFSIEIVEELAGMIVLHITGASAWELFRHESGGHRWQRVPPNERNGKVHSSTVTVAVFRDVPAGEFRLRECDVTITTCRGSGPGGQKRNKTDSAVQVKHIPTGLIVRCETERSQLQNKSTALALLTARLVTQQETKQAQAEGFSRRSQIGSGERSDKIRTVQMQNGQVVNHRSGKRLSIERYLKGELTEIQICE